MNSFTRFSLLLLVSIFVAIIAIVLKQPNLDKFADLYRSIDEIIESRGFKWEEHYIQSSDGYILKTFRIINPYVKDRKSLKPILLHHGFQCSGSVWLVASNGRLENDGKYVEDDQNGKIGNSLGFVLASQGYDVWLANFRGNIYSRNHTTMQIDDLKFWNFTIDDMTAKDFPAQIEYIRKETGKKTLAYIGHSQGNYMMFNLFASQPQYSQFIKPHIALSPVTYFTRFEASLKYLGPIKKQILMLQPRDFGTHILRKLGIPRLCANPMLQQNVCYWIYWILFGSPREQIDFSRMPIYYDNVGHGSGTRNLIHLLQHVAQPSYYDHSIESSTRNVQLYGREYPPMYKYSKINSTDIALIYTHRDWFNHLADIYLLKDNLNVQLVDDFMVPDKTWNHMELVWGKNVGTVVNARILQILNKY